MATEPIPKVKGRNRPSRPDPGPRGHIGWVIAGSLATGLVAAILLAAAPFVPAQESGVTGAVPAGRGHDAAWSAAQNRLARLSTNSVHRSIAGATHEDLIANQDDAAATQAILDVVASVRSPRRLVR